VLLSVITAGQSQRSAVAGGGGGTLTTRWNRVVRQQTTEIEPDSCLASNITQTLRCVQTS